MGISAETHFLGGGDNLLRMMTVNCNGIYKRKKYLSLGDLLRTLQIGVCVVSESHLRRKDLRRIKIPGCVLLAHFCRIARGRWIGGGVAIMVRTTVTAEELDSGEGDDRIESCSMYIYPEGRGGTRIKVTGVYITPRNAARLELAHLMECSGVRPEDMNDEEASTPHLIMGDLNPPSWTELLAEWCSEAGMWELGNPKLPTHTGGGVAEPGPSVPGGLRADSAPPTGGGRRRARWGEGG